MRLPLGVTDPIFLCELALELGMPISELGERMSAYELTVTWPEYFRSRARSQARADAKAEKNRTKARRR